MQFYISSSREHASPILPTQYPSYLVSCLVAVAGICGVQTTVQTQSLVFSSSQTALKSDPSLQMNPNTLGGNGPAQWERQSETQQGERTPAKSPMQHSAALLSFVSLRLTEKTATVEANERGVLINTAHSCTGTY